MGIKKIKTHYDEFELDLTPLLAIIMKLVPVLIITSSFLQLTQINTDLPQVIKEAIKNQDANKDKPFSLVVSIDKARNITISAKSDNKEDNYEIKSVNQQIDFKDFNDKLIAIKKINPQIFKLTLAPDESLAYDEIVKLMDEARKPRESKIEFLFKDSLTGKDVKTDYMFPEVVFGNIFN